MLIPEGLGPAGGVAILSSALAVFCGWRGARPFDPHAGPRLVPYRLLMVTLATVAVLALGYMASRFGPVTR